MWWKQRDEYSMEEWDPIGVADTPEALDEYDSYVGPIGAQLREGATVTEIEDYLRHVRLWLMGLVGSPDWRSRDHATAQRLVDWYTSETRSPDA